MPDKYQDEIEKILEGLGETPPTNNPGEPGKPTRSTPSELSTANSKSTRTGSGRRSWSVSPGKLAVAGVLFLLLSIVIKPLIWAGLGLLVGAYLLFFVKPRSSSSYDKRWRGQTVEDSPSSAWEKLKRWIKS